MVETVNVFVDELGQQSLSFTEAQTLVTLLHDPDLETQSLLKGLGEEHLVDVTQEAQLGIVVRTRALGWSSGLGVVLMEVDSHSGEDLIEGLYLAGEAHVLQQVEHLAVLEEALVNLDIEDVLIWAHWSVVDLDVIFEVVHWHRRLGSSDVTPLNVVDPSQFYLGLVDLLGLLRETSIHLLELESLAIGNELHPVTFLLVVESVLLLNVVLQLQQLLSLLETGGDLICLLQGNLFLLLKVLSIRETALVKRLLEELVLLPERIGVLLVSQILSGLVKEASVHVMKASSQLTSGDIGLGVFEPLGSLVVLLDKLLLLALKFDKLLPEILDF